MYSVMLVDDDYPVLEYLSASIPWKELHLEIHSACKNGAIALEQAQAAPPDIVITDIGMPQMDGIALIGQLKRLKPDIRCIILSCMGDFSYAQQAVRLQVDDYVLKETMRPEQIVALLRKLSAQLAAEKEQSRELARLQSKKEENALLLRQGLLDRMNADGGRDLEWADGASEAGIGFEGKVWLPVLVALNRLSELSRRLPDDRALQLAVGQAASGLTGELPGTLLLPHGRREAMLLFPFRRSLTEMKVESVRPSLRALGERLSAESGIAATFLIGTSSAAPAALGRAVQQLLSSGGGRFYLPEEGIFTLAELPTIGEGDLHEVYPEALQRIRDAFLEEDMAQLESAVGHWLDQARERRCHPELVKEWTLKILFDNQTRFFGVAALSERILDGSAASNAGRHCHDSRAGRLDAAVFQRKNAAARPDLQAVAAFRDIARPAIRQPQHRLENHARRGRGHAAYQLELFQPAVQARDGLQLHSIRHQRQDGTRQGIARPKQHQRGRSRGAPGIRE
ncbi:response regulator [Cohnella rhizosphaerae]|uniref:Response regulator n=1 Tax=Cohnella rhizosphaerae TaxID=1457232 RepID=A0A9X4KX42_9BACL|nr:response regulator [Cohnella rhizosphaerae]MDG0809632.1 response regulator [Cohnella rhizosphaerae]